ncbi:hypothetical protein L1049_006828 [Liquidambar formosana]|uniref:Uncharacterized protein n=1 Tax=Liquidambar formosana TaxID=63359 RepID=A0AAP0RHW1_LIQFO
MQSSKKAAKRAERDQLAAMAALGEGSHNVHISSGDTTEESPAIIPSQDSQEMKNCPVEEPQQPKWKRGETNRKTIAMDGAKHVEIQFNGSPLDKSIIDVALFIPIYIYILNIFKNINHL